MIARAFSSMPGLASGIARQIRDGEIKKFLIQPIDLIGFLLAGADGATSWCTTAWRIGAVRARVLSVPRLLSAAGRRRKCWRRLSISLVLSFLLGFFLEALDGPGRLLVARGQLAAVRLHAVQFLLLGAHVPAEHAAASRGTRSSCHAAAVPGVFSGGRVPGEDHRPSDCGRGLAIQAAWVVFFIVACRVAVATRGVATRTAEFGG